MTATERWLLPAGVEEILPPRAWRLDALRRRLLDLYWSWGYDLMFPPFIEYLESLLTGVAHDLDLQTFKVMDQMSGRLMGIRADMTPQAARIDAHVINRDGPSRLCYLGTVLRARPEGVSTSRSPLQVGAELFGHEGEASDVEVVSLMLETLRTAGARNLTLDLGHVAVYRSLAAQAGLDGEVERELFDILRRKAVQEYQRALAGLDLSEAHRQRLASLVDLHGGPEVLDRAREELDGSGATVEVALDRLSNVADRVQGQYPELQLHFDLAELHSYHYENGLVFGAFHPGQGQALARGGRYDGIGEVFGRARPATGFSADLKGLLECGDDGGVDHRQGGIFAPADDDPDLAEAIDRLRESGERVVQSLPGAKQSPEECNCDRVLQRQAKAWIVTTV
ncbi:ATP phosphoribosyltransferase regulatory subunit [Natronospira proteinivora]|uniref:ATP phosphoribosyltransferase regulatory subunit n=1 Tax=Natronospira proteinivora TaxID=1807133 RepID=A0ABT1G4K1_9GAMM|nr:ATP phosphoribosyltransferase regulatory subunit [Natronospira proteinivora]MCP1726215.1 ATP phosphoribosyltransferase regulatory subunit [Natronospira proteinivora]